MARKEYQCDYCGYETMRLSGSYLCPVCHHVLKPTHPQRIAKKPIQRLWWVWTIILLIIVVIGWHNKEWISYTVQEVSSVISAQKKTQSTSKQFDNSSKPAESLNPFSIDDCKEIDYKTLARNPDKYINAAVKATVVVKQTFENNGIKYYACYDYVEDQLFTNLDAVKAYIVYDLREKQAERILVDDIITVYGTFSGIQRVKQVITNVEIDALNIKMMDSVLVDDGE